jgi:Cupin-like domain
MHRQDLRGRRSVVVPTWTVTSVLVAFCIISKSICLCCVEGQDSKLECSLTNENDDDVSLTGSVWNIMSHDIVRRCNIERYTWTEFQTKFHVYNGNLPLLYPYPLIIRNDDNDDDGNNNTNNIYQNRNEAFRRLVDRDTIVDFFPKNFNVTLSSSNSFSEHRRTISLVQYIDEIVTNSSSSSSGHDDDGGVLSHDVRANETWYLFGETFSDDWKRLLRHYVLPPCQACIREDDDPSGPFAALSFGIGGRGSGVQWHVHGPGWSESLVGRKHWVLLEPDQKPNFHPDQTSYNWMYYDYPKLFMATNSGDGHGDSHDDDDVVDSGDTRNRRKRKSSEPWECTVDVGELIYFPDMWWHATINLDVYTAFVSTFTQDHLVTSRHGQNEELERSNEG